MRIIEEAYDAILAHGAKPLTIGGDHTIPLPILRAMKKVHGPLGVIHVDAHADVNEHMFGEPIAHGTPFRRGIEEGLIDPKRMAQIGLRGSGYTAEDFDWAAALGVRVVPAEDCWHKSLTPLMAEIRAQMGDGPVYLTFDIDALDPGFAPGTGTPEIGGLTTVQAPRDRPRLPRPQPRRRRLRRGLAALRPLRQHRDHRGVPALRDALRDAGRPVPHLKGQRP